MDLKISTRVVGSVTILEVSGEIELSNAAQLREALMRACHDEQPGLVVDMSGVAFIDSTGIGVLVGALKRARECNGAFVLACPQRRVRRVFEITGLLSVFALSATVEDALR
ncbi:MAG TPA: STAS domain-containing protein, partial [Abditibacteriaceae bacterium]|nr:STAS domain-containing protein [Abditibacteriaceae bacterium]